MASRRRQFVVGRAESGRTISLLLQGRLHLAPDDVNSALMKGAVRINGRTCCNRSWRVRSGQRVEIRLAVGTMHKRNQGSACRD